MVKTNEYSGAKVVSSGTYVVELSGKCVVVLAACIGKCTSISCSLPIAHNTEHDSRHVCKIVAVDSGIVHIATHDDKHSPGAVVVVGIPAVVPLTCAAVVPGTEPVVVDALAVVGPGVVL